MMEIINEQIIAGAKRIIDDVQIIEQDLEWLANDMRCIPEEHLDMHARDFVHKLLAISKIKIERAWEIKNNTMLYRVKLPNTEDILFKQENENGDDFYFFDRESMEHHECVDKFTEDEIKENFRWAWDLGFVENIKKQEWRD